MKCWPYIPLHHKLDSRTPLYLNINQKIQFMLHTDYSYLCSFDIKVKMLFQLIIPGYQLLSKMATTHLFKEISLGFGGSVFKTAK